MKWRGFGRKQLGTNLTCYISIYLQKLRKIMVRIHGGGSSGRIYNWDLQYTQREFCPLDSDIP
jgi:hypothetical protein